jgi:hypothetical protein
MTVGSANVDDPQELLNIARHHCQAIQTIIDQLTEIKSNTELRLLSQRLQRLAFHAAPRTSSGPPFVERSSIFTQWVDN